MLLVGAGHYLRWRTSGCFDLSFLSHENVQVARKMNKHKQEANEDHKTTRAQHLPPTGGRRKCLAHNLNHLLGTLIKRVNVRQHQDLSRRLY